MNTLEQRVSHGQDLPNTILEELIAQHPLPWSASPCGKKWEVVAVDGFPVVRECTDWEEATAIINIANGTCIADVLTV